VDNPVLQGSKTLLERLLERLDCGSIVPIG